MILKIVGNVCVGLALLLYLIPLPLLNSAPPEHEGNQSKFWGLAIILILLWIFLTIALGVSTAQGAFDGLWLSRGAQYFLVVVTCMAMAAQTILSGVLRDEPPDQMPWAMRPLAPGAWAMWVFPLVVVTFCVLTINQGLGSSVPRWVLRLPVAAVGGVSWLVIAGFMCQWITNRVRQERSRVAGDVAEVQALDPQNDFRKLLSFTWRRLPPEVRQPAVAKIRATPDLEERLAAGLRSDSYYEVLIFLEDNDPPDRRPLAAPALDAFMSLAKRVREDIQQHPADRVDPLWGPQYFDTEASVVLLVADKFGGFGVDYTPGVRAVRSALDEPHDPPIKFECAAKLDQWLSRNSK